MLDAKKCSKSAEREGFEPSVPVTQYARLAIWCLRPLGHLSAADTASLCVNQTTGKSALLSLQNLARTLRNIRRLRYS
jgi:hypothetical protein